MDKNIKLSRNINKNYVYILLQNVDLTRGIWMLYLASKGMSLTQLGLLETIFHITSFTMEVPTGAIADIFGRKISRLMGRILALVHVMLLLFASNFLWFAISFIFSALSYNLESGAGDALVYDSLKEIGREDEYMKVSGNKEVFYQVASTISFLVGGYLATKGYSIAFGLTTIIGIITLLQAFTFTEPTVGKNCRRQKEENIFVSQLKESIRVIDKNRKIGFLIIFVEIIMAFSTCIFYYLQNYLKGNGYNEAMIGLIYASASLLAAFTATKVHKIENRIREKGILMYVPFITAVAIWGVALSRVHFIFFIALSIAEGIIYVAVGDYINKMIPSENRATILSFSSMVFSFFMITLFPLVGMIGDRFTLVVAFKFLGILSTILVIINYLILKRKNNTPQNQ